jgi:hypothetical protein
VHGEGGTTRVYSLLDYARFTILVFGEDDAELEIPPFARGIRIHPRRRQGAGLWAESCPYADQVIWVRPDGYIATASPTGAKGSSSSRGYPA